MTKVKSDDLCQVRCFNHKVVAEVRADLPLTDTLEEAEIIFTALADKSRLKILYALQDGKELCVCDLAAILGVPIAAVSHHLRKLRDLKILKHRNDGKLAYYSLRNQFVGNVLHYVLKNSPS
ncbi:ArsR/SmtB family transcription factor [Phormidesmis priestleyi]